MLIVSLTHLWWFTGVRWCLFYLLSSLLCSSCLELWSSRPSGQEHKYCSCIKLVGFFVRIFLCASCLGENKLTFFFVFAATPVRITRLKRKQKMGRGQKMGHRELAVLQGKNAEFISTWNKSRIDHHMSSLLLFNCYFLAEVPGRTLWRSQSWRISRTWATW